ncbi:MAG: type II secretion system F family protein [Candidatus Paceibacterota bacterium]
MKFNYQARTELGEIKVGTVEAMDRESVFKILKDRGFYVTFVEEAKIPFYARKVKIFDKIKKKDVAAFSRQIAIMFKSRIPLVEIFQTLSKQTTSANLKDKILKISREIEGGASLSDAFSMYPGVFSPFYVNMVKSGETSGKLVDAFLYLADYLEKEESFKRKIIGAMIYPVLILFVFVAVVGLAVIFIIPQLAVLLEETGGDLPLLTRIVIWGSEFGKTKGWIILIFLVLLVYGFLRWIKTIKGKRFFDKVVIKIPMLKDFLKKLYLARIALNLSTLISGGLPIALSLEVTGEVVGNSVYRDILMKTRNGVKQGEPISSTFGQYPNEISPFFYQMVVVGEKTGTIDSSLKNVVYFYEEEIERELANFIKIIEPVLIIILGLIVGGLMAAILIPIYSISMV